jgi:hypothetical protein
MNLISDLERSIFEDALNSMHTTFARDITVVNSIKTPVLDLSDANDDYDHVNNSNQGSEEFTYSYVESTVTARVKYIDRQDKEFSLVASSTSDQINLVQEFGLIRIKVLSADCELVNEATHIIVDDNHCRVIFRDSPHGLFENNYCTFYVQRVP